MVTNVWVEESFLGTHNWPDASGNVEFLKHKHHHNFIIRVEAQVTHADRELEFLQLRLALRRAIADLFINDNGIVQFEHDSCEMIAALLKQWFTRVYDGFTFRVSVSEDGWQGAIVHD